MYLSNNVASQSIVSTNLLCVIKTDKCAVNTDYISEKYQRNKSILGNFAQVVREATSLRAILNGNNSIPSHAIFNMHIERDTDNIKVFGDIKYNELYKKITELLEVKFIPRLVGNFTEKALITIDLDIEY